MNDCEKCKTYIEKSVCTEPPLRPTYMFEIARCSVYAGFWFIQGSVWQDFTVLLFVFTGPLGRSGKTYSYFKEIIEDGTRRLEDQERLPP